MVEVSVGVLAFCEHFCEFRLKGALFLLENAKGLVVLGHACVEAGLFILAEFSFAHVYLGLREAVSVGLSDVFDAGPLVLSSR